MLGRRLGHYVLLERLGAGGMGVVYRARDERLRRDVALKVLATGVLTDEEARRRFRAEALSLSRLDHPGILTIYDFDQDDGIDFLVTQLVQGKTLEERIREGALPEREIAETGAKLADALQAAHEQGVVHRDVKPSNVLVTDTGAVKLVDFGIARRTPSGESLTLRATVDGGIRGTLPYLAPEVISGSEPGPGTDLYALGVVLYRMGTARLPFDANEPAALLHDILHRTPPAPRSLNPRLSRRFEEVVGRALEKSPDDRHASAAEVARDLRALANELTEGHAPRARVRRSWKVGAPRRSAWRFAVVGALALTLLAAGVQLTLRPWDKEPSLAILPFANALAEPQTDYLSDGITETLINRMSEIPDLKVIARSSVFEYKGREIDVQEVGRSLGVRTVMLGRLQGSGSKLLISVELVDVHGKRQLWGDRFEIDPANLLDAPDRIRRDVAHAMRLDTDADELRPQPAVGGDRGRAFQLYLQGRYHINRPSEANVTRAIAYFQEAIKAAPDFAPPYAGLADCYYALSNIYLPPKVAMPRVRSAAERALQLDPNLAEGHASLGVYLLGYDWKWTRAESELRRAVELNPGYSMAHFYTGLALLALGRNDESRAEMLRARELDPLSSVISVWAAVPLVNSDRYDEAIQELRALILADPTYGHSYRQLALTYSCAGRHEEALTLSRQALEFDSSPYSYGILGHVLAKGGRTNEALALVDTLELKSRTEFVGPANFAVIYAGLGDGERAADWLEKALEARDEHLVLLAVDPTFRGILSHPRVQAILRRMDIES